MSAQEVSGPTVEEAIDEGLRQLGMSRDQVEVEVLSEEAGAARVRVTPSAAAEVVPSPEEELTEEQRLEYAREDSLDFLEGLLEAMGLRGEVEVEIVGQDIRARMAGDDLGPLIGRHGRTLEAVQELLRASVQHQAAGRVRVILDIEGYRERRREAVEEMAQEMAERALREGEVRLEPMPAFERKVVHDAVATIEGVSSLSEGEEPRRYVVIRSNSASE